MFFKLLSHWVSTGDKLQTFAQELNVMKRLWGFLISTHELHIMETFYTHDTQTAVKSAADVSVKVTTHSDIRTTLLFQQ